MKTTSNSLHLRPLLENDIDPLAQIMAETPLWQRYAVSKEKATLRLQSGLREQASIIVAEVDGKAAGFVWFVDKGAFHRSGYIMLLAVDGKLRRQGIGNALMDHAESILFANSNDVFLLVSDFNGNAQRFYLQRGYQQVGKIPHYVIPDVTELIFRKQNAIFPTKPG